MREIDQLKPPTAGRLLTIWRETGRLAKTKLERSLLCNARVLTESCYFQGERVFASDTEVLETLTTRQMEGLLRRLTGEETPAAEAVNPAFDVERFRALEEA